MSQKFIIAVLCVLAGAAAVLLIEGTPEQRGKRDVARCMEVARIMMGHLDIPAQDKRAQANLAYQCLMGRQQP